MESDLAPDLDEADKSCVDTVKMINTDDHLPHKVRTQGRGFKKGAYTCEYGAECGGADEWERDCAFTGNKMEQIVLCRQSCTCTMGVACNAQERFTYEIDLDLGAEINLYMLYIYVYIS